MNKGWGKPGLWIQAHLTSSCITPKLGNFEQVLFLLRGPECSSETPLFPPALALRLGGLLRGQALALPLKGFWDPANFSGPFDPGSFRRTGAPEPLSFHPKGQSGKRVSTPVYCQPCVLVVLD